MKISVFTQIGLPKNKEEKRVLSKFSSYPHLPEEERVNNLDTLIHITTNWGWSPFTFKGHRKQDNFLSCDFAVLDIDDSLTIEDAKKRVKELNYLCICMPTASHTKELNKFRLIFPLSKSIKESRRINSTMRLLFNAFPEADRSCLNDTSRFYFPCKKSDDGFIHRTSNLLMPQRFVPMKAKPKKNGVTTQSDEVQKYSKTLFGEITYLPDFVVHFMENAHSGLPGVWNSTLNRVAFTLALKGANLETIVEFFENHAPEELDDNDMTTINSAFVRGKIYKEKGNVY